ncbi:hypothetical protein RI103_11485 [Paraburkholderia sp. FT54]|uniref:hypothetical protein n=1 Tax=Paraburkholderia sp. FT54 TaxID=3074437 RepID=UPI0028778627|nr:hypothetical protein [Paraburkholderia sp. FT54]WNC88353.1 hypothetical protein RI103_11485 [Paraburkholderia sp. FT54]
MKSVRDCGVVVRIHSYRDAIEYPVGSYNYIEACWKAENGPLPVTNLLLFCADAARNAER